MSSTTSQRLDAARKEARELREFIKNLHEVAELLDPLYIEYLAELKREMVTPSRLGESLGVGVTGTPDEQHGPRRSTPAANGLTTEQRAQRLRAEKMWQHRRGERGLGSDRSVGGTFERIVYGKDRRWMPSGNSTSTRMTA